jgi:hypothetical protein
MLLLLIIACKPQDIQDIVSIDDTQYTWVCQDRQSQTEISMSVQHCYPEAKNIKVELIIDSGLVYDFYLIEEYECLWEGLYSMKEEVCIQITDVDVVAELILEE